MREQGGGRERKRDGVESRERTDRKRVTERECERETLGRESRKKRERRQGYREERVEGRVKRKEY